VRSPYVGSGFSRTVIVALALSSVAFTPLFAQDGPVVRLTIEEAQARALAASHRLAEARARETAAKAGVDVRASADRPTIAAVAGYSRTQHVIPFAVPGALGVPRLLYPDVPDNYHSRLDLQWPIYTGGQTSALERAARAEATAVGAEVLVAQADLRLEVARAFWGLVPPNEIASAEAQESRSRMLAIEARNQRDVAVAELTRLVGLDPGQVVEPATMLDIPSTAATAIDPLVAEARTSRQERQALEQRVEAAEQTRAAAAAASLPTISIAGGVDYARPNPRIFPRADRWDDSWDAGVNVRWPLWDGGRTAANVAQAAGGAEASRQRLAEFDSVLSVEVRQRALDVESGRAAIAAANDAVRAASEARRVVTERYRAGVIAQIEVLDAEFALLQAELDRTRGLANLRLSEARLARAVGR
jgi:outer membrane protein TolC